MDSLPFDLVKAYLSRSLLRLVSKKYNELPETGLNKPWVFDGVLVDVLRYVNPYNQSWFEVSRSDDLYMGWFIKWGNASLTKAYSLDLAPHSASTSFFNHEYTFKVIAEAVLSSLMLNDAALAIRTVRKAFRLYKSKLDPFGLCIYKGKCEYVRDALLSAGLDKKSIIYLPNIRHYLGPLMKTIPNDILLSINESLYEEQPLDRNSFHYEMEVIRDHVPNYHASNAHLYRFSKSIDIRFRFELSRLTYVSEEYLEETGVVIIEEALVDGFKVGLICAGLYSLPSLHLID